MMAGASDEAAVGLRSSSPGASSLASVSSYSDGLPEWPSALPTFSGGGAAAPLGLGLGPRGHGGTSPPLMRSSDEETEESTEEAGEWAGLENRHKGLESEEC